MGQEMNSIDIDVGGTFTDAVIKYEGKEVWVKVPTTTYDLSVCFINVIEEGAKELKVPLDELLKNIDVIRYSTTMAMNRLIERRGPRLGLITTEGFEDTIFIGRGAQWIDGKKPTERRNIALQRKPEPLIPRDLVVGVKERIDYTGKIIRPLDEDDVRSKVHYLVRKGVRGFVVSLLHSYANPAHERRVKEIIREEYKDYHIGLLPVVLSSEVAPKLGEYWRTMTAILDAYLRSSMKIELSTMWDRVRERGFKGAFLMVHNTGGMLDVFKTSACKTYNGGPVAGLIGSYYITLQLGYKNVVTTDVGGTSFDVGLVVEQSVRTYEFRPVIDTWMVCLPMLRTISIGAGGGSIARFNELLGRVEVGPQSAGAMPGPACYDLGGTEPTVTDADVVLGYIDPRYYYGGKMLLNKDKAVKAIKEKIADPLGVDVVEAAATIRKVVDGNMRAAIHKEVFLSGYDPRDFVMFAFGGGGPTHCEGYHGDVPKIIIFPYSPVFCARGSSIMDIVHIYERSKRMVLLEFQTMRPTTDYEGFNGVVRSLMEEARRDLMAEKIPPEKAIFSLELDMKYGGQYQEKRVLSPRLFINSEEDVKAIVDAMNAEFASAFSPFIVYPEGGVFIENFALKVTVPTPKPPLPTYPLEGPDPSGALKGRREAYWEGSFIMTNVYDYERLKPGNVVEGPAIGETRYTTIVVPPKYTLRIDEHNLGIMEKEGR
jgi:N-methylhydantoinase A/acetophenone carboxylase